jgi:hypothetical protein
MKPRGRDIPKPTVCDVDKFIREKNKKEIRQAIESFRAHARSSDNPYLRAISLGDQRDRIDTSTLFPQQVPETPYRAPNVVSDRGGEFMLSQGVLPHAVHGRYDHLPTPSLWAEAEKKQRELRAELAVIESRISVKENDIRMKSTVSSSSSSQPKLGLYMQRPLTAPVIGSTFKFHSIDARTTANSDFAWPEADPTRIRLKNSQYGLCTRVCDDPRGNLAIRHGVGRKPRPYKDYMHNDS